MAGVLETVNRRTQLVGQNRLELLIFTLGDGQQYGINVFKVKEVLCCPHLNKVPKRHPVVKGVARVRGGTIPILDLRHATGQSPLEDLADTFVIITEYNRSTQGFIVKDVERIVNMNWGEIHPPPRGAGKDSYLTAVTHIDDKLVEIIDVEKVLSEVSPFSVAISEDVLAEVNSPDREEFRRHILIIDDSTIARKQIKRVIESLGIETTLKKDGREALEYLKELVNAGINPYQEVMMIISDIEMPEMDGYTFTAEIRANANFRDLHVILHTSLSGVFNEAMVKKVGANDFLAKFHPDELAKRVSNRIKSLSQK